MLPGKLNLFHFRLASLISGFLRAAQLFTLNPLSSLHTVHVEMLLVALANTAPELLSHNRISPKVEVKFASIRPGFKYTAVPIQHPGWHNCFRKENLLTASPNYFA